MVVFCDSILRTRNIAVDILAIFFGISSWISINGLWVELPLLVDKLPEGWNLASYLSIIVQIANLGPISVALLRWRLKDKFSSSWIIVVLLILGSASSLMMVTFWQRTSSIGGVDHSTALFTLVFFLSLVDCTSSVLFLPFMGIFKDIYLNSYLVGEGLSGFVPSIAALIQGVGGNPYCENVTITYANGTEDIQTEKVVPDPRFSIEVFFGFLTAMMIISLVAFLFLNFHPKCKDEQSENHLLPQSEPSEDLSIYNNVSKRKLHCLLFIQAYVCFISNGAFPSIQTYSCLPYGNAVYHLSVTLNAMANPVMAFFAFFVPCTRLRSIATITVVGSIFGGFILATSLNSPDMLWGQELGGALTVISWVVYGGLFSYVKVSVFGACRQASNTALFWAGALTQIGSAFGALLMFILVNVTTGVFNAYYVTCN